MKLNKFSRKERQLLALCGLLMLFLIGGGSWWAWSNTTPQIVIPEPPPAPKPNAYDYFVKAAKLVVPTPLLFYNEKAPKLEVTHFADFKKSYLLSSREKWLKQNTAALKIMRQGLAFRSQYPPRTEWQRSSSQLRELGRVLSTESQIRVLRGNWKGATQSALDEIRLGNGFARGGPTIASLMCYTLISNGITDLQALAEGLDAATSRSAALQLHELMRDAPTATEALHEDKWMRQKMYRDVFSRSDWRQQFAASMASGTNAAAAILTMMPGTQPSAWDRAKWWMQNKKVAAQTWTYSKRQMLANYNAVANAAISAAKQPFKQAKSKRGGDYLSDLFVDMYSRSIWHEVHIRARASLLETALALRAYRLEHGSYPNSLDALVPNYLPSVPRDTFTDDKPLRYRREGTGYKLWSIGPDGKDDDGQAVVDTSHQKRNEVSFDANSKGDLAYRINH